VHGGSAPEQLMSEAVTLLHRVRARREPVSRLAEVIEACDRTVQQVPTHPLARQILASAQALQRLTTAADAGSGRWERFTRLLHPTPKP
jgi:hypothetical protein